MPKVKNEVSSFKAARWSDKCTQKFTNCDNTSELFMRVHKISRRNVNDTLDYLVFVSYFHNVPNRSL